MFDPELVLLDNIYVVETRMGITKVVGFLIGIFLRKNHNGLFYSFLFRLNGKAKINSQVNLNQLIVLKKI